MDELQKAFNRTKTRMADASRKTEEKEQSQDESIAHAHNDTAALREKVLGRGKNAINICVAFLAFY